MPWASCTELLQALAQAGALPWDRVASLIEASAQSPLPATWPELADDPRTTSFWTSDQRDALRANEPDRVMFGNLVFLERIPNTEFRERWRILDSRLGQQVQGTLQPTAPRPWPLHPQSGAWWPYAVESSAIESGAVENKPAESFWWLEHQPPGQSVRKLLHGLGPMPYPMVRDWLGQIGATLKLAAAQGAFHGRLNSQCLWVDPVLPSGKLSPEGGMIWCPAPQAQVHLADWRFPQETDPAPEQQDSAALAHLALEWLLHPQQAECPATELWPELRPDVPPEVWPHLEAARQAPTSLAPDWWAMLPPESGANSPMANGTSDLDSESRLADLVDNALLAEPTARSTTRTAPTTRADSPSSATAEPAAFVPAAYIPAPEIPDLLDSAGESTVSAPRSPRASLGYTAEQKKKIYLWVGLGLGLQCLALLLWVLYATGQFQSDPPSRTPAKKSSR